MEETVPFKGYRTCTQQPQNAEKRILEIIITKHTENYDKKEKIL